jgi:hypothetical protein
MKILDTILKICSEASLALPNFEPGYQADTFGIEINSLFELIEMQRINPEDIRVVRNGEIVDPSEYITQGSCPKVESNKITALYLHNSCTLVFQNLNHYFPRLQNLMLHLRSKSGRWKFKANAYLTPANSAGFEAHWDLTEVMLLQMCGSKKWKVWDPIFRNPFFSADQMMMENTVRMYSNSSKPQMELDLKQGDVLLIPRGYVHSGITSDQESLHISIGFKDLTVLDEINNLYSESFLSSGSIKKILICNPNSNLYQREDEYFKKRDELIGQLNGVFYAGPC